MKKILLVGKLNLVMQNLYESLENRYSLQICEPAANAVKSMSKIVKPDGILVFMTTEVSEELLRSLRFELSETENIPVVVICGSGDGYANRYKGPNMRFVFKPVSMEVLVHAINEVTGGEEMPEEEFAFETPVRPVKTGKKKILAIDDDAMVLRTIRGILQDEYEVVVTTDVEKGINLTWGHDFDAILLDYEMPEIDGFTAFATFKINFNTQNTPVIFLTGVSDKNRIADVIKLKPAAYLLKPVEADKLKQVLREVLG